MKTLIAFLLGFLSCAALAGLGSTPSSFGSGTPATTTAFGAGGGPIYTDQKRTLDSGTVVHEYVNAGGIVFAVSWSGPFMPDLDVLLGSYFQYLLAQSQKQSRGDRSHIEVRRDDVVIYSGGRMGAFEGKAWLPALLPAGFKTSDVR